MEEYPFRKSPWQRDTTEEIKELISSIEKFNRLTIMNRRRKKSKERKTKLREKTATG